MENPIIQTDLATVLRDFQSEFKEIKGEQKKILEEINQVKVTLAEVKTEIKALNVTVNDLKTNSTRQLWVFVGAFVVGVLGVLSKILFLE